MWKWIELIIWLPLLLSSQPAAPPAASYTCTPPAGITVHLTNPQLAVDSAGRVFCATRAASSIGGVVWTMDGETARVLMQKGPQEFYANGEFTLIGGWLYYVTVDQSARHQTAYLVPEWAP